MNLTELSKDKSKPRYVRPELQAYLSTLQLMDRLCAGPKTMWQHSHEYIRKWPDEDPEVYNVRRNGEAVFIGTKRTVNAAVGMLWGKEPLTVWNESENTLKPLADNIDGTGTKLAVFGKQFSDRAIKHGIAAILVDHASAPKDADGKRVTITAANEAQYNLRPLWKMYARHDILSWKETTINSVKTVTQVVLFESRTTDGGEYGVAEENLFRVLRLRQVNGGLIATWDLLKETEQANGSVTYDNIGNGTFRNRLGVAANFLPLSVAYTGTKTANFVADVPLEGVGYANLGHWEYATDLKFNRRVAAFEQMVISGELQRDESLPPTQKPSVKIGPLVAIHLTQGGSVTWSGPSGTGLAQLENGQREKMEQMNQLGFGFLLPTVVVQKTATETAINSYAQMSTLSTAGIGIADAINLSWEHTGWYYGITKEQCPVMTINTNYVDGKMTADIIGAYVALVTAGFPKMLVLQMLQDGGRIPEDAKLDEVLLEWESELTAQNDIKLAQADAMKASMGSVDQAPVDEDLPA